MKTTFGQRARRRTTSAGLGGERGTVIVVVMIFSMIFLILGLSLYWLTASQIRATETERSDVKAFNVAEAGVDAGMLALKLHWPSYSEDQVVVDEALIKASLQEDNATLWDPKRSPISEFIQVAVYDNSLAGVTVTVPPDPSQRVAWDANGDGRMFIDASSNVDDDRHRILVLAEKQKWDFTFPVGLALFADVVDANGLGYGIEIEDGIPTIYYDVHDSQSKGIEPGSGLANLPTATTFEEVFTDALRRSVEGLAIQQGTFFTDGEEAEAFLTSGLANGAVVYIKSDAPVDIEGTTQIGNVAEPLVVVIDTPEGSVNTWDMKGTADFFGVLVNLGNTTLRGTCSTHGAMYCAGTLLNKGEGSEAEMFYNAEVLNKLNRQYVISVNIVPNTWEEYTQTAGVEEGAAG